MQHNRFKKTRTQQRADRIESLAKQLILPSTAIDIVGIRSIQHSTAEIPIQSFVDPDPFQELTYPTVIAAKQAIAEYLGRPLAKLTPEQMAYVDAICTSTLNKQAVMEKVREYFYPKPGSPHAE